MFIPNAKRYKHTRFVWPRAWRMAFTGKGKRILSGGRSPWVYSLLLLCLAFPALAALPSSEQVSNSPLTGYNGLYTLSGNTDSGGYPYYVKSGGGYTTCYMYEYFYQGYNYWAFYTALDSSSFAYISTSVVTPSNTPIGMGFATSPTGGATPLTVSVPTSPPTGTFSVSPASINPGGTATLTWSVQGATTVTIDNGIGSVAASGSQSVSPSQSTTYTLTATNSAGSVTSTANLQVNAPTIQSLTASPTGISGTSTQTVTLTVVLSSAAPPGGASVNFGVTTSGGWGGNYSVPGALSIGAGGTSGTTTATVQPSTTSGSLTYAATYGSSSQTAAVTVAAAAPALPKTLYVYGAGNTADNGTYTLIGPQSANASAYYYTLNGVTTGTSGPGFETGTSGSVLLGHINAATGGNAAQGAPYADYGQASGADVTSAGCAYTPFSGTPGSYAPAPTVSTTPQTTSGGGGSGGTGGTSTAAGSPGVSASLSPYGIASGYSSVLRWDTSGASVVTVTGVANPSTSGTVNVSPTSTTTYTITATNGNGTTTQQVTLQVDGAGATGGVGVSTFVPGSGLVFGNNPALPTLPTIPTLSNLPKPTLPPFTIPGIGTPSLPGDLKIGIPGLGSIGIPTGWLTQIIQYAGEAAQIATGMTGAVLTAGMQYAAAGTSLAVYDAGAAVQSSVNTQGQATQQAVNTQGQNVQYAVQTGTSTLNATLISTAQATQQTITTNTNNLSAATPSGLLTQLFQYLFVPDQATVNNFTSQFSQLINWGPIAFVANTLATFQAGAATVSGAPVMPFGSVPQVETGPTASLAHPHLRGSTLRPSDVARVTDPVPTTSPGTDLAIPVMAPDVTSTPSPPILGVQTSTAGVWAPTGYSVPFDFSRMTSSKFWAFFRLLEGASVYLVFCFGIMKKLFPQQVL